MIQTPTSNYYYISLFYFLLFFSILCVFMFYGLMSEIKMDWIGLDWKKKKVRDLSATCSEPGRKLGRNLVLNTKQFLTKLMEFGL